MVRNMKVSEGISDELQWLKKLVLGGESGFSILELIVYIGIVGVIVTMAVPRYTNAMAMANTAKIQADLQTIDTAIAMYHMQNGTLPANITTDLNDYINNADVIAPPAGDCILGSGDTMAVTATEYTISSTGEAQCQGHNLGEFTKKEEKRGAAAT